MSGARNVGVTCPNCDRGNVPLDRLLCIRCEAEESTHPLRLWLDGAGWSIDELAEATQIGPATAARALRGDRLSARVAAKLERLTKIPADTWRTA